MLENIERGTPVHCSDGGPSVGEVRGVYTSGESRIAEYLCIFWRDRGEETLLATDEVLSLEDRGVLLRASRASYADLVRFDATRNPVIHPLNG